MFKIKETKEAKLDVKKLAAYMVFSLKNGQAASDFLDHYNNQAQKLSTFPSGYRGIGIKYQGYEIRIKPFSSYNIFFVANEITNQITILRVLKDRQNWKNILHNQNKYSF